MKKLFLLFAAAFALVSTGCQYDDGDLWNKIDDHEARLKSLETTVKQMNDEIGAMNTIINALEQNDWITGVSQLPDGSGYTITFNKQNPITIKNGEKGAQGEPGTAPVIGVSAVDGVYYWTLNGEFIQDGEGNNLPVSGSKGDQGEPGQPGQPGQNAIAPQVRVNDTTFEWEISTDGGTTWESTGVVAKGEDGTGGDSFFSDVDTTSDPNSVTFTLADGSTFTLPRMGTAPSVTFTNLTNGAFEFVADGTPYYVTYTPSTTVANIGIASAIAAGWDVTMDAANNRIAVSTSNVGEIQVLVVATSTDGGAASYWITLRTTAPLVPPVDPATLQTVIDAADDNDVIVLAAGNVSLDTPINVNKPLTIQGAPNGGTVFNLNGVSQQADGIGRFLNISAPNVVIDGLVVEQSEDIAGDFIWVTAADVTVKNSKFTGPANSTQPDTGMGYPLLVRTFMVNSGTEFSFIGNTVDQFTNPSYLEGLVTVTNNVFTNIRGFVVTNNHEIIMTDNTANSTGVICLLDVIDNENGAGPIGLNIYDEDRMTELYLTNNNAPVKNELDGGTNIDAQGQKTFTGQP